MIPENEDIIKAWMTKAKVALGLAFHRKICYNPITLFPDFEVVFNI